MAKARKSAAPPPGPAARLLSWLGLHEPAARMRLLHGVGQTCLLALALGGAVFGLRSMETRIQDLPNFQKTPELRVKKPSWMLDRWVHEIALEAGLYENDKVADPHLVARLAHEFASQPWVARVNSVRKYTDGRVIVDCDFRQPVAMVKSGLDFFLVDADGLVLKQADADEERLSFLRIYGVAQQAPRPGQLWPGKDLRAGIKLAQAIANQPFRSQVEGILLDNYDGRISDRKPHIELATNVQDRRIRWGRAPGEEDGKENSAEQKLLLLNAIHHRNGRVDMHVDYVDVRFDPYSVGIPDRDSRNPSLRS